MGVRRLRGMLYGCLLVVMGAEVQAEPIWETMKQLLAEGQAEQAYQEGSAVVEAHEGELEFDYYYGMAAIDAGEVSRGVFALERVLYQRPNFQAAQLELARGYFLLEQYDLAKQTFMRVLAATPPDSVREKINLFLSVIEKREASQQPRLLAYAEAISGYDGNTNYAPADSTFFSPTLGEGTLSDDGVSKSGGFNDLLAGVSFYRPFDERTTEFFRLDLADHNVWWTGDIDTFAYTAQMGFITKTTVDTSVTAQFLYQNYELAGEGYRSMTGFAASTSTTLNPLRSVQFAASVLDFDYDNIDSRDAREYNLSAGINQQTSWLYPALWTATFQIGQSDPEEDSVASRAQTERDFWRLALSQRVPLADDLGLSTSLSYQKSEYGDDDIFFLVTRDDKLLDFTAQLDWRWDIRWKLSLEAGYKKQDSNIAIYEYDRTHVQLGVRYDYY